MKFNLIKINLLSHHIIQYLLAILVVVILAMSVRGEYGNPISNELTRDEWMTNGPFELSPERGRFGLLYSLVEDDSYFFSVDLARFIAPDLGYLNNKYVSLFAPAVSYITIPGYLLGKLFGLSQVGSFFIISVFATINCLLIIQIVKKFTNNNTASKLSGLVFLFATPAYAYGVNLYQHHISTFLILCSLSILLTTRKIWPMFFVWFLCAMSIPVDYPNLFLMFPIGLFALDRIIKFRTNYSSIKLYYLKIMFTFIGLVIPILFFMWFNYNSYNNPLQFSGTVPSAAAIDNEGKPTAPKGFNFENIEKYLNPDIQKKSTLNFFKPRNLINGLYLHILSPDRGIIYFTPVILVGILGIVILQKRKNEYLPMLLGIVFANITLYSMWGDPWGGWAFGSRYLIPSYAIMSLFIGVALFEFKKKWLFLILFYLLLVYSIGVNTLGAITTSANPPKVEALPLEAITGRRERYSYDRNWEFLTSGKSKSFVFQTWGKNYVNSVQYYYIISGTIVTLVTILMVGLIIKKHE